MKTIFAVAFSLALCIKADPVDFIVSETFRGTWPTCGVGFCQQLVVNQGKSDFSVILRGPVSSELVVYGDPPVPSLNVEKFGYETAVRFDLPIGSIFDSPHISGVRITWVNRPSLQQNFRVFWMSTNSGGDGTVDALSGFGTYNTLNGHVQGQSWFNDSVDPFLAGSIAYRFAPRIPHQEYPLMQFWMASWGDIPYEMAPVVEIRAITTPEPATWLLLSASFLALALRKPFPPRNPT